MPRKTKNKTTPAAIPEPPPAPRAPGYNSLLLITLVLVGAATYANSLNNPFILRDVDRILQADHLHQLGSSMQSRQPVIDLTFAMNYAVDGVKVEGYHVVNIAIHLLAGLTLYGLTRRTLCTPPLCDHFGRGATWIAFAIALLWLVHPLNTESVTYVANRDESLMGLFFLLTLYSVLRGATASRGTGWLVAAVLFCGLGMGSNAVMITAPIVVLAFDRIYLAPTMSELMKRRGLMYLGLGATWLVPIASGVVRSVLDANNTTATVGFGVQGVSAAEYAITQPGVLLQYFKLSVWPYALCVDYAWRPIRTVTESGAIALVIVAAVLIWTLVTLIKKPRLGFIGLWFFLILAPTSSVIPTSEPLAEHRMYLPLIAIVTLGVIGIHLVMVDLLGRDSMGRSVLAVLAVLFVSAPLVFGTVQRNSDYAGELIMWEAVLDKRPDNTRALVAVGAALVDRGVFIDGEAVLRRAISLDANNGEAHYQLGRRYALQSQHREALHQFDNALKLGRIDADLYTHLGESSTMLGAYEQSRGYLEEALALEPDNIAALMHHGNALYLLDRPAESAVSFQRVIELDPKHVEGYKQYSLALAKLGRTSEAIEACDRALALLPEDEGAQIQRRLLVERLEEQKEAP